MSDMLVTKGVDRLKRRMDKYRSHHDESVPRFEHTTNGLNEQQKTDTQFLRQRFLENKPKKTAKKSDKAKGHHSDGPGSSKMQKRQCEEIDLASGGNNGPENYEPPSKMAHCNGNTQGSFKSQQSGPSHAQSKSHQSKNNSSSKNDSLTKFSLEIVHQVELTSSSGTNPLQNVTVKTLTNANLKSGHGHGSSPSSSMSSHSPMSLPNSGPGSNCKTTSYSSSNTLNIELKQSNDSDHSAFADLDQCAAALEKDAANSNGSMISGLMGLGDGSQDGLIPSDTLKDLISEISDLNPDFLGDFDFDEDRSDIGVSMPTVNSNMQNSTNHMDMNSYGNHGHHSHTPPVAPVTPTATSNASSPRLSHVKMESESSSIGHPHSVESNSGNRGLSHCAGPSPAAASTASPLASQLNSHHPSQTPPYCSGSGMFDSTSPSGAQGHNHPSSGSSTPNYCPQTTTPTPPAGQGHAMGSKGTRIPYTSPNGVVHDSPAAQTLKQMAEQHQHKLVMGNYKPPGSNPSPARSPFNGDSYGGYNGNPGDFNNGSTNPPNYPNVRTQSMGVVSGGVSDSMGMGMNGQMKQEISGNMYNAQSVNQQQGYPPIEMNSSMMNKRNIHASQQQQHQMSQQHKGPATGGTLPGLLNATPNNSNLRMSNPNQMMQQKQQQQSPLHPNKSFTHAGNPGPHQGPNHMGNSHLPPSYGINRPPTPGNIPNSQQTYPQNSHNSHGTYNNSNPNSNHPSVKMSQSQQMTLSQANNSSGSLQVSGTQQMAMGSGDLKSNSNSGNGGLITIQQQQNMSGYYQNVPQQVLQQQQQQSQGSMDSNGSYLNSVVSPGPGPHQGMATTPGGTSASNAQGQTINFTQQHLRMATSVPPAVPGMNGMGRMMGASPPGVPGPSPNTRMPAPNRTSQPGAGMPEMGGVMNPRAAQIEMQQRMMVRQQLRGQTMQHQQQQMSGMLRPPAPDYAAKGEMISGAQQQIMGQNPNQAAMMARFNAASSGPGRPSLMSTPQQSQMGGVHRLPQQQQLQQQQASMYQHQQMQQRMGTAGCGPPGSVPSNMPMGNMNMNNMNMPMRRMSSYNPNGAPPPGSIPNVNPGMGMNGGPMMTNSQQSQPGMGSVNMGNGISQQEWMAMQQESNLSRNFPNMQQQLQQQQQGHRSNQNPSGFHPGMSMQMSQQQQLQQQQMNQMPMGGGQGGMGSNPMTAMAFGQQQQQHMNGGGPVYSQQSMNMKMSQSQSMCVGSNNFALKNGGMAISNNNTGSGGTLIQSPPMNCGPSSNPQQLHHQQSLQQQHHQQHLVNNQNAMKSEIMTNQSDFNFDLLDNIGSGDPSGYGGDSDFLNSFEASANYQNILDSL